MDLRVVTVCQDVCGHVSLRGVLFQIVPMSGNDCATVAFHLNTALRVIHRGEEVLNPQDFVVMLKEP